jgi:hypothetical protein
MQNLIYLLATALVLVWAIGFFAYSAGDGIHLLLLFAVTAIVFRLLKRKDF